MEEILVGEGKPFLPSFIEVYSATRVSKLLCFLFHLDEQPPIYRANVIFLCFDI